jgi:formamidopyrimidine-DNA glycosylase
MPELPEVETTRRGIAPHITGRRIARLVVRDARLRWPVEPTLARTLAGQRITAVERRGKYLLFGLERGTLILHLGMSGSLQLVIADAPAGRHDHVDLRFDNGHCLRLTDPRRFGALLYTREAARQHPLLATLGPEPLADDFDGDALWRCAHGRRVAIKQFLMDSHVVVGVGNIYASEALFRAGVHPARAAGRVSRARCAALVVAIKAVLTEAIAQGGTTLRDFVGGDGRPGYFRQRLAVYGRAGKPCPRCAQPIRLLRQGQRASYYCVHCQR